MELRKPLALSSEGIFRFQAVSQLLARISRGHSRTEAVEQVAAETHFTLAGHPRLVSTRTLLRWLAAYEQHGVEGLDPAPRPLSQGCGVLPPEFVTFLASEKDTDPHASLPELIRRARLLGILKESESVDRTTVYRVCRRTGISVARRKKPHGGDTRRFAYPHRMEMALCDGKHFRAGVSRAKRVALTYLDDACRYALHGVIGPSEAEDLFLRGLYELFLKFGFMGIFFLDKGPGFIGEGVFRVLAHFNIKLIHGTTRYPEGHGKIEVFNRSGGRNLLRHWDGRPDIDPQCGPLELRYQHYLFEIYNKTPHSALGFKTPEQCFFQDTQALRFPLNTEQLRQGFVLPHSRRVSKDHVVSFESQDYELPTGYAGSKATLYHNLLDGQIHFVHQGRLIRLHPVDLEKNARSRRGGGPQKKKPQVQPLTKSAADLAFERDYTPLVDPDGGFSDPS
jgi:transposase InsO family protein